ncbi:hypothetical protein [Embleya sp. AB8]|uniref:hypothetical protein n=1 Tax=Embleya sp. AB8 TaxID=3156304 RepID=UPI003C71420D
MALSMYDESPGVIRAERAPRAQSSRPAPANSPSRQVDSGRVTMITGQSPVFGEDLSIVDLDGVTIFAMIISAVCGSPPPYG